ncbi:hypothetical protein LDENG_00035420 [Lucifuga dentata]|nr:hypothetical protein LDENG_00035420 [Lucifuga dentata]
MTGGEKRRGGEEETFLLRAGTTDELLQQQSGRARKLQGDRLSLEDFAQFLNLPVTDTLSQVHSFFHQDEDGRIDVRQYVTALSTVCRPSEPLQTLKLAFKIYGSEESGEVLEEDLATILEIMLGMEELELSALFLSLDGPDTGKITYDDLHHFIEQHSDFTYSYLHFRNCPVDCFLPPITSSNGHKKDD